MAKMKGTFAVKVANGSAAGFSNIPGASSYTASFARQFGAKFQKAYNKKKKEGVGNAPAPQETGVKNAPAAQATSPAVAEKVATPKVSGARLGGFKVDAKPGGIAQVKSTSKKISLEDIKDPNSKTKNPIKPENIPDSYKPQGDAPSSRQWSEADKAALESERPKGYVDPNFKAEQDSPEAGAARLKALSDEMSSSAKAKKMASGAPVSKSSPRIKKSTPSSAGQQWSNTANLPAVNLDNL
jgi:hypothetical protein